jgi:hypothetical protein
LITPQAYCQKRVDGCLISSSKQVFSVIRILAASG